MTTIGVISDTHGLLRPEAKIQLAGVDHIIHAGDIGGPDIIPTLGEIAPVTAIKGNIDQAAWANAFADQEILDIASHRIFILHNRNELDEFPGPAGFDIVVSGHSHKPSIETVGGILYLNPGSAGPKRFNLPITVGLLTMDEKTVCGEIIPLKK